MAQPEEVTKHTPFKIERSLAGVINGFMDVAERIVNEELEVKAAAAANASLNGASKAIQTAINSLKTYDTSTSAAREVAARVLGIAYQPEQKKD
jgi:hypothetical protein